MKKLLKTISLTLCVTMSTFLYSQLAGFEKELARTSTLSDECNFAIEAPDSSIVVCQNLSITKLDQSGNVMWTTTPSGFISFEILQKKGNIEFLKNDNILLVGARGFGALSGNPESLELDLSNGNIVGTTKIVTPPGAVVHPQSYLNIKKDRDGNFIGQGTSAMGSINFPVPILTKFDTLGNVLWTKEYHSNFENLFSTPPFVQTENSLDIDTTTDGGYVFIANSQIHNDISVNDIIVIKVNANGNILWQKRFGGTPALQDDYVNSILSLPQSIGGGYIVGNNFATQTGGAGFLRLDNNGNLLYAKSFLFNNFMDFFFWDVILTSDNSLLFAGFNNNLDTVTGGSNPHGLLLKSDLNGNVIWAKEYQSTTQLHTVTETSAGNLIANGINKGSSPTKGVVIKANNLGESGCETPIVATSVTTTAFDKVASYNELVIGSIQQVNDSRTAPIVQNDVCCTISLNIQGVPYICGGQPTTLSVPSGYLSYLWSPGGQTTNSITVTQIGMYQVTVIDSNGCYGKASVLVQDAPPVHVQLVGPTVSCSSENLYCDLNYQGFNYQWTVTGAAYSAPDSNGCDTVIWPTNPNGSSTGGTVKVTVTDPSTGCFASDSIFVLDCCVGNAFGRDINFVDSTATYWLQQYFAHPSVNGTNQIGTGWTTSKNYPDSSYLTINGTLRVDTTLIFGEADVRFGQNAKIIVQSFDTLKIFGSYFHSCDSSMWDGIYLEQNAVLEVNSSYFEDALNAVVSKKGAPYFITASTFNKNYIGILVEPHTSTHQGILDGCRFTSTPLGSAFSPGSKLNPPYSGQKAYIGVDIRSVDTIRIGSPNLQPNLFDRLENGIRTSYSNAIIENNQFKYIVELGIISFPPLHRAIWVTNVASPGTSASNLHTVFIGGDANNLQPNQFDSCQYGVWGNQSTHMVIIGNRFREMFTAGVYYEGVNSLNNVDVKGNNFRNAFRGVVAWQNSMCNSLITDNTFWYPNYYNSTGIAVLAQESTGQRFNLHNMGVICNNIFGPKTGIKMVNMRNPAIIQNIIYPYTLNSNIEAEGIRLDNNIGARLERNTIRGGSPTQLHVTGIRSDNSNGVSATCNVPSFLGRGFVFSGSQPGTYWAFNYMIYNRFGLTLNEGGVIFPQKTVLNGITYPNENRWVNNYTTPSPNFHTRAQGNINPSNGALSDLTVRQSLPFFGYVPFKNNAQQAPLSNTVTYTQVNTTLGSGICAFTCNPSGATGGVISDNLSADIAQGNIPFSGNNVAALWQWSRRHLFRNLIDNPSLNDTLLIHYRDSLRNASMGVIDSISELLCVDTLSQSAVLGLQSANISAQPADTMQALQREVNGICLAKQISGSKVLTVQQFSQLQSIANMCPFTEGDAVYMARAIIDPLDTGNYVNPCEALDNSGSSSRIAKPDVPVVNQQQAVAFNIYPNPSNGNFTIDYQLEQGGQMEVYDITGKMVKQIMLNSTNQREEFETGY
jgi:hypothetical protein